MIRRKFNTVGNPQLPGKPTLAEIAVWLRDKAKWQEIQPYGRDMDAREWAATCLNSAAEDVECKGETKGATKFVKWHWYDGGFWFRIFGRGLSMIDKSKHSPLFSERNGYRKVLRIGKWGVEIL